MDGLRGGLRPRVLVVLRMHGSLCCLAEGQGQRGIQGFLPADATGGADIFLGPPEEV